MDGNVFAAPVQTLNDLASDSRRAPYRRRLRSDVLRVAQDTLVLWDAAVIALSGYICAFLYLYWSEREVDPDFVSSAGRIALLGGLLSPFVLMDRDSAKALGTATLTGMVARLGRRGAVLLAVLLAVGFITRIIETVPRLWALSWIGAAFLATVGNRWWLLRLARTLRKRGLLGERVAVIGGGIVADQLLRHVAQARNSGVEIVGVFDDVLAADSAESDRSLSRLVAMGQRGQVDRVILTLPAADEARVFETVYRLKSLDVEVAHCPSLLGSPGAVAHMAHVAGAPVMVLTNRPMDRWGTVLKGVEDRVLAGLAIIVLVPLLAGLAVAVRLDSPGPVVFRQRRHGWNGTEFQVFKFRTMRWQAGLAAGTGERQTSRNDLRVTRVGKFLRSTSLDELPQLLNVLNGTMSLVGPRPHPVVMRTEQLLCEEIIAEYSHRHRVKPGITGWAQVNGHRGATETAQQVRKRVEHDIFYIENWSLLFDLKILLLTPYRVLFDRSNAF